MTSAVLPFLLPLATAVVLLLWWQPGVWRRCFAAGSCALQFGVAAYLAVQASDGVPVVTAAGDWAAPLGIILVVDLLAAVLLLLSAFMGTVTLLYGFGEFGIKVEHPLRLPLVQFLLAGVNLAFITGDLFNLFVAYEIMLVSSYALMTLEANDWDVKQALPYVVLNALTSLLFLCALGFTYALLGTLNMADLSARALAAQEDPRLVIWAAFVLFVFAVKAGLFPLYFWMPNSYPILPASLAALFAGLLTKVGVYSVVRFVVTVLPPQMSGVHAVILGIAVVTIVVGVCGALARNYIRGILAFHSVSQIGYILLAVGLFSPYALGAALYFLIHHSLVKSSLFLAGGSAAYLNRSDDLARMGGLWKAVPFLGVVFLLLALSLAGLPPLSGFWAKYTVAVAGLREAAFWSIGIAVAAGILTLLSMLKIWLAAFWSPLPPGGLAPRTGSWLTMTSVAAIVTVVTLVYGLGAELFAPGLMRAGAQAFDPQLYRDAVILHPARS